MMKHTLKSLFLIAAPCITMLASCSTFSTVAHRHGELVHSHTLTSVTDSNHQHETKSVDKTTIKTANKKVVAPVKPAKKSDIKPLGLKAIGQEHHTHIEPKTAIESVPC